MASRFKAVLLFGTPGAGKGTQGAMLGAIPGFFHFSTGDMFRSLDPESELGAVFANYSSRGELVPDDVTVEVWQQYMRALTTLNLFRPHRDLLILDGIPRNPNQATIMDIHVEVLGIVHLTSPDREAMVERLRGRALKQKRVDDAQEDVIRRRLEVYEAETAPVLDYYESMLVREVDALGSPARVLANVLDAVVPIQEAAFSTVECS